MPKGGALSLNAISGIGMLAVGTLGFPYIGALQAEKAIEAVEANEAAQTAGLVKDGKISAKALADKDIYEIIKYQNLIGDAAAMGVTDEKAAKSIDGDVKRSAQGALGNMIVFPGIMLVAYLLLMGYYRQGGGYQAVELDEGGGGDDAGGDDGKSEAAEEPPAPEGNEAEGGDEDDES